MKKILTITFALTLTISSLAGLQFSEKQDIVERHPEPWATSSINVAKERHPEP